MTNTNELKRNEPDTMTRDNTGTEDRIELFAEPHETAKMEGEILRAIDEHGSLTSDGTLDIESVMEHVGTESGSYVFRTFGKHGRIVRYTDDVDEPRARFLREGSTSLRRELNDLIREHGVVGDDGRLDIEAAKENLPDDAPEARKKTLYEMVGRYTRICVPLDERPDPAPTTKDSRKSEVGELNIMHLVDPEDVPDEVPDIIRYGWDLRKRWEATKK